MILNRLNSCIYKNIGFIEMIGVLMRVSSFSLVSWMGAESPFFFVWAFNTTDAVILSWCSLLKKDNAYSLLNVFWIMVGVVGMLRASSYSFIDFKIAGLHFLAQFVTIFSQ